jgi:hypothetical protein
MGDNPLEGKTGIMLDIGCGGAKMYPQAVGMDKRALPGVDVVHDLEVFPYPFADGTVIALIANHILEHIKPWYTIDLFNECWRICAVGTRWLITLPYGINDHFVKDPTHCNPFNEATFNYFDPFPKLLGWKDGEADGGGQPNPLYTIYRPKPWRIVDATWESNGHMTVILEKRDEQAAKEYYDNLENQS